MKGRVIFTETQSFVGTWMWYLVLFITVLIVVGSSVPLILQPSTNEALIALTISAIVMVSVIVVLATSKLHISIDERNIYYRFPPFVNGEKQLGKDKIKKLYIRKYKPIWEYGGYGYRFRFRSGRAMIVSGDTGLQLELKNGKKVLIGTQKPDSMHTAVKRMQENWEPNG